MAKSSNGSKSFRSAGTGQFVTKEFAAKNPETTLGERRGGGKTGGKNRSAGTGRFVTEAHAAKHPNTTVKDG